MPQRNAGVAFGLAVAAAVEIAALFYMLSDPDVHFPSLAEMGHSDVVDVAAIAIPLGVIVFLFFTRSGRALMHGLQKNQPN